MPVLMAGGAPPDIACLDLNDRNAGKERIDVDRPVEHPVRHHADAARTGCDGGRLAVAERSADAQALATSTTSVAACHAHGCPRLVNEAWLVGIEVESARALCTDAEPLSGTPTR